MSNIKISLHRRDETQIANIFDVINPVYKQNYGGVNELTFRIPYYIVDTFTHNKIPNLIVNLIRDYYLIKFNDEFMIVTIPKKYSDDKSEYMDIQAYSRQFELGDKRIRDFKTGVPTLPVKNLTDTVSLVLANTNWSVDIIETQAILNTKYRAVEITDSTVLDAINKICEVWDCIPKYDTINRKISFVQYKDDGYFTGLILSSTTYLKNISYEKISELKTCLKCYGKNGVSFQAVNPTGQNFITNYSFLKQTGYMPNDLVTALENYENAISGNTDFADYLEQKAILQSQLLTKQNELDLLLNANTTGLYAIQDLIDIAIANGEDTTELRGREAVQQALVNAKLGEINTINSQISAVDANILNLRNTTLNIANYLTEDQIALLRDFTFEDVYIDNSITAKGTTVDVLQEFYEEAVKRLNILATPRYSCSLDVADFYQATGTEIDRDKLVLGSICKVKYPELDIYLDAKIVEIEQNFDDYSLSITVANEKDIKGGFFTSQNFIKQSANNNSILSLYGDTWSAGGEANNLITNFLNNAIDTTKQTINSAVNDSVQINRRGITIQDTTDPQYIMRITSGAIALSSDGGQTWKTGMSKGVVHGDVIAGNIVIGQQGIFNSIKMYDEDNNLVAELGRYISQDGVTEKNGLKINGGALEIIGGGSGQNLVLGENYNNMVIDGENGITVTRNDNKVRILINAVDGIKIQKSNDSGNTWIDVLNFDENGNGKFSGIVDAEDYRINGETILSNNKISGEFIESINAGIINAGDLNLTGEMKITNADGSIQIDSNGILVMDASGNSTILNQYGINPKSLKWFKNMCYNSSFERFDATTKVPAYWSGGKSTSNSNFYGSYSLQLNAGEASQQTIEAVINSDYYKTISDYTRVSFHKKNGAVKISVLNAIDNMPFELTNENGETGTYIEYPYNENWLPDSYTVSFNHVIDGIPQEFYIKFENSDAENRPCYIDAVIVEPDYTGMWPSFYTDGPKSDANENGQPLGSGVIDNLTRLDFYNNGFTATYGSDTVSFAWELDSEGVITSLITEDNTTIPVNWHSGGM